MLFKAFSRKFLPKASAIGYTMSSKVSKVLLNLLLNDRLFYESYIIVYSFSSRRIYAKINTLYLDTPYLRGYIFPYGSLISQMPITLFVNMDSRCLKKDLVENAIETIIEGRASLYIAIPFTTSNLTMLYKDSVYTILKDVGIGLELLYPSYTLVVGKSRIFKDAPYSLWSSEILATLLTELTSGKGSVKVDNITCVDQAPQIVGNLGEIYMSNLARDIVTMLLSRKVIDEAQSRRYLKMMVNGS